jgi:hypothetical protein
MLRSFLLSGLRRHDCRSVAQPLGRRLACWSKSRGYPQPDNASDTDDVVDHPSRKRRHLYLVLDDWSNGFSIHKLDLYSNDGSDGSGGLPLPAPVHRQEKTHVTRSCYRYDLSHWNFAALGSKIIAAGALGPDEDGVTLTYDTKTAGLSAVPRLPATLRCTWTLATAPVGNGLYVFEPNSERYRKGEEVGNGMHRLDAPGCYRQHWSWGSIPSMLPFSVYNIESSVVHPKEGGGPATLFVSVGRWDRKYDERGNPFDPKEDQASTGAFTRTSETFSYAGAGQWRCHGKWDLPFCGQGQYDSELDTWVGLHKLHGPSRWPYNMDIARHTDGYLCSSEVISPEEDSTTQPPASKLCTERLFDPDGAWRVGASLVYMGDSTYCLVEVDALETFQERRAGNKSAVRLSVFRLKYGKNGELTITARRPDRSYLFSRFDENTKVRAFWM